MKVGSGIWREAGVAGCGLLLGVLVGVPARAGAQSTQKTQTLAMHLDAEKTKITWTAGNVLHREHGTFKLKGGEVIADPKSGVAQGEVLIDAASGTTGDAKRDAVWQKDVLDSENYPAIIFHPSKVDGLKESDGEQTVKATGTLTLHGTDHPVELTLKVVINGHDAAVTSRFDVPYVKWGLKNPNSGMMRFDRSVAVEIAARGTIEEKMATPAAATGK